MAPRGCGTQAVLHNPGRRKQQLGQPQHCRLSLKRKKTNPMVHYGRSQEISHSSKARGEGWPRVVISPEGTGAKESPGFS